MNVIVLNATNKDILRMNFDAQHGAFRFYNNAIQYTFEPPFRIYAHTAGSLTCAETGVFTGAKGWAKYCVDGKEDQNARFDFYVPYFADNEYFNSVSWRPQMQMVTETPR
jgi:hypothetical protein